MSAQCESKTRRPWRMALASIQSAKLAARAAGAPLGFSSYRRCGCSCASSPAYRVRPPLSAAVQIRQNELARVNLPVAVLVWLSDRADVTIDFGALHDAPPPEGCGVTLFINWGVETVFHGTTRLAFSSAMQPGRVAAGRAADSYVAGLIPLSACLAPP